MSIATFAIRKVREAYPLKNDFYGMIFNIFASKTRRQTPKKLQNPNAFTHINSLNLIELVVIRWRING